MIVRILGEAQYDLDTEATAKLDALDGPLDAALTSGDDAAFAEVLKRAIEIVKNDGTALEVDDLRPSELVLPAANMTVAEVRALLSSESVTK